MIELLLRRPPVRALVTDAPTEGELLVEGVFRCATREAPDLGLDAAMSLAELRRRKVLGQTAIPTGRYRVYLYHSPRYGRDTLALADVPVFFAVQIAASEPLDGSIAVSPTALASLKDQLVPRLRAGEECWLTVARADLMGRGTPADG